MHTRPRTVTEHIRAHLLRETPTIAELRESEWCHDFEELQRNRLIVGAFRYGRLGDPNKPQYDRCVAMTSRLGKYRETGNTEFLVDIANLAMLEFVEGTHPNKHFAATDGDDAEHVNVIE